MSNRLTAKPAVSSPSAGDVLYVDGPTGVRALDAGFPEASVSTVIRTKGGTYYAADYGQISDTLAVSHLAIQAAIEAAYADGGGEVLLPVGLILLGGSLVPRRGVSLRGIKPMTFSNTGTPDGNFNIVGGTRLSFPGGIIFDQDVSADFATHQAVGQADIRCMGFTNCEQIIRSGAQSKHGYWDTTFADLVGDNITGTAFEFGNPQHILLKSIRLNNPLRALHLYTNYRNSEVVNSPGNSQVIDFYASMSAAQTNQPGLLLESKAGQDGYLGALSFYRFQINRGNNGVKAGYNVEIRGTSTPIVSTNFEGLDIEGSADHGFHINGCHRCRIHVNGVSGTGTHVNRSIYVANSTGLVIESDDAAATLEFADTTSASTTVLYGIIGSPGGTNMKAVGLYRDTSNSGKLCFRWAQYDTSKWEGDGFTVTYGGTLDFSGARIKRRVVTHTGGALPEGYASDIVKLSTAASSTAVPSSTNCATECTRYINTSAGAVTITGVTGGDITLTANGSMVDVQAISGAWYLVNKQGT